MSSGTVTLLEADVCCCVQGVVDVKADALKGPVLEPVIELDTKEDSQSEPDDDASAAADSRKVQRSADPDKDKRQVVADSDSDGDARDVRRVSDAGDSRRVNGGVAPPRRQDDRLQHTSDSDISDSDDDAAAEAKKDEEAAPVEKSTLQYSCD